MTQDVLLANMRDEMVSNMIVMFLRLVTSAELQRRADFFAPFIMVRPDTLERAGVLGGGLCMLGASWPGHVSRAAAQGGFPCAFHHGAAYCLEDGCGCVLDGGKHGRGLCPGS